MVQEKGVEEELRKYTAFAVSKLSLLRLKDQIARCVLEIPEDSKVLEVGCGSGYALALLTTMRPDLTIAATDIKPSASWEWLRSKGYDIEQDDATDSNLDDSSFGCVVSFGVMEHTSKPEAFVAELERVLVPQGLALIFNLPNRWAINDCVARLTKKGGHTDRYTTRRIRQMFDGFRIEELYLEHLIPAQAYRVSGQLNRWFNKHHRFIDGLDRALTATPLSAFAQSYYIKARKP